jgi:hypothetical protein
MNYKTSSSIDNALQGMATQYPDTCAKFYLDEPTWAAKNVPAVRIQEGIDSLTPVLFTGGVHGRELAPPDALLSFCENLLDADFNGTDVIYSAFTDASGITYDQYIVDIATVRRILNTFSLFVVPCVNPDGRDFVLFSSDKAHKMWRKNRRPDPTCVGVDINRNFPFVWDVDTYYKPSVIQDIHVSKVRCDPKFRGNTQAPPPDSGPEPETQNLINLVAQQSIQYLVDVHMFGRNVFYPWGMDTDQIADTTQTFSNATWDGKRDGPDQNVYGEYLPATLLTTLVQLADAMGTEIKRSAGANPTAIARSAYTAKQSALAGATTGAFDDYTFGQQFLHPRSDAASTCAFTLECGYEKPGDDDGGFAPHPDTQYPKVEREVHAALFGLLNAI